MKGISGIAGLTVLGIALAGWMAPMWGQSNLGKLPPSANPPIEATLLPGQQPAAPAPSAGGPPAPVNFNPPPSLPGTNPSGPPAAPPPAPALPQAPSGPASGRPPVDVGGEKITPVSAPGQGATTTPADDRDVPGQQPDNPTGRQEPAISMEWIGAPQAKVGKPGDYALAVRNACNIPVQQVMVRVRIPAGMTVTATEPKAFAEGNVLMWELGTLIPKQEKNLQMRIVAEGKGMMGCQAWVTFTGASAMHIKVSEPKLVLKAIAPEKVMVGDAATIVLTVSNPGDGPAEQVKIHALLSEGLEHPRGRNVDFEVGNLAPGESRSVQLICGTKVGGEQRCDGLAEADGDLKAQDRCVVNVIMPRLDLDVAGPKLRYLERKAVYTFKVTNPGDASATNVTVSDVVPPGFKFLNASDGGRHDFSTRTVSWFLGEIGPGQSKDVKMEVLAINPGEFHHKVTAQAARGLRVDNEITTRIEGLSAILLEVVDTEDPIEVGAGTAYEIRITNTGSKTETDIKLVCTVPDKMQFVGAQGPVRFHEQGRDVIFDALPKLAPRADAIFRINVKATAPGDVRFKAQITSTNLVEPVLEMESTRIYED
jgi:uncharacterized repeat protein (TIGR01451 family)